MQPRNLFLLAEGGGHKRYQRHSQGLEILILSTTQETIRSQLNHQLNAKTCGV